MNRNGQAGDGVLLQAQLANVEIVDHVLRVQHEFDLVIHGNRQRGHDDVVFAGGIVGIDAQRIAGGSADLRGIEAAEFSVRAGIAEIENELVGGDFDANGVGFSGREARVGPGFASEQAQTDEKNDRRRGPDHFQRVIAARERARWPRSR